MASHPADLDWDHSVGENLLVDEDDEFDDGLEQLAFYNGWVNGGASLLILTIIVSFVSGFSCLFTVTIVSKTGYKYWMPA